MKITSSIRRSIATVLMTAGLAYPVCAAVCPKGIGGCTAPGRCFLFTDTDGNALCDYTSRTGSPTPAGSVPSSPGATIQVQTPVQAAATPTPDPTSLPVTTNPAHTSSMTAVTPGPDATSSVLQNVSNGGFFDTIHVSAPLAGACLFLILSGVLFILIRRGMPGIRIRRPLPALALSSLFGLGLSLIATSFLTGNAIAGTTYALIYMGAGTLLAAYLWHAGVMNRRIVLAAAALGTLAGFVFLAPIMPMELGGVVNVVTGTSAPTAGVLLICIVIGLTLITGRTFCGTICPVGSLQELAYAVPVRKLPVRHTEFFELARLAIFVVTVIAALYLIDLMALTRLYDLFSLTFSAGLFIAAGLILISVFFYRPVCRVFCPFGLLFSLFAEFSWFRLRRTDTCISCRKCEKACPTRTAGAEDSKRECYLCGSCTGACPFDGALEYGR